MSFLNNGAYVETTTGRYKLGKKLGEGAYGQVYDVGMGIGTSKVFFVGDGDCVLAGDGSLQGTNGPCYQLLDHLLIVSSKGKRTHHSWHVSSHPRMGMCSGKNQLI